MHFTGASLEYVDCGEVLQMVADCGESEGVVEKVVVLEAFVRRNIYRASSRQGTLYFAEDKPPSFNLHS